MLDDPLNLEDLMRCSFSASGGLRLAADVLTGGSRPPVLLLHGGGQTRHAWDATAGVLAERGWSVVLVDLRGHGDSDWAPDGGYGPDAIAADVRELARALDAAPVLVGASLGGLAALLAVGEAPTVRAAGLVLVDVAHRFEAGGARRIVDFMTRHPGGFADPSEALDEVARYLPHRARPADPTGIEKNLRVRDGRWFWHWDPKLLGAARPLLNPGAAAALSDRLRAALRGLAVPTVLIRGALSDVVTDAIAEEFDELVPGARVMEVRRAAHMVAGDDNANFTDAVLSFLEALPARPG